MNPDNQLLLLIGSKSTPKRGIVVLYLLLYHVINLCKASIFGVLM